MDTTELKRRLEAEGCNPLRYAVGARGAASDAFCLTHDGRRWNVFYTERGEDSPPIYSSDDEAEACEFFFGHVMAERHDHMVGFFIDEADARALRERLRRVGVASWQDRIPFGGMHDPRFRVFVTGKAIFAARQELGTIPLGDLPWRTDW
jgi:hypothetical protein